MHEGVQIQLDYAHTQFIQCYIYISLARSCYSLRRSFSSFAILIKLGAPLQLRSRFGIVVKLGLSQVK